MTPEQFQRAMGHLVAGGLKLPHGVLPGSYPGGLRPFRSEAEWRAYGWNPPEYLVGREGFEACWEADPEAGPKPTWAALVEAERAARLGALPGALIRQANAQAKARIAAAYVDTPDRIEELIWRLNGRATAAQDAERARLVAVCHALERRIGEAATIEALEAIDVTGDAAWVPRAGGGDGDEG